MLLLSILCFVDRRVNGLKIAICDDDLLELQKTESIVRNVLCSNQAENTVDTFTSGKELLAHIEKSGGFNLLILDIIMDGLDGIELAARIRERDNNCKIIFLTSSPEYAVASYKVKAFYYLLKGELEEELHKLLQKVIQEGQNDSDKSLMVKEKGKWTSVPLSALQYVDIINHSVCFHLNNNETITSFNTLNAFEDALLSDMHFVKCHKSFIVNMSYVKSITGKDFIMTGGTQIPISRNVYQQVKDQYFDYFFMK